MQDIFLLTDEFEGDSETEEVKYGSSDEDFNPRKEKEEKLRKFNSLKCGVTWTENSSYFLFSITLKHN